MVRRASYLLDPHKWIFFFLIFEINDFLGYW